MGLQFPAWMLKAKCANDKQLQQNLQQVRTGFGIDPFFPAKGKGQENQQGQWAKEYCLGCEVRLACLAEAMKSLDEKEINRQLDGIWGGMTRRMRASLKKKQTERILEISARMKEQFPGADENRIA